MKTKHILTAMALPALFAACTADDIVSPDNGLQQDQRAKLSKDFVLNVNNEVESRYAVVEGATGLKFNFEEGDKIGANLIDSYEPGEGYNSTTWDKEDPATWKIIKTVAPALPFINEGGVWKSANEDLGIGNYLFTNPFNPADKNRAAAGYELPVVVQYSSENPNAHIEAYNKAVAAQITYEGQTSANADLKNIFAYPMIRINFDKKLDVKKVTKVVLARNYTVTTTSNGSSTSTIVEGTPFIYKGAFNHQAVAKMFNPATLEAYLKENKKNTKESYWAQFQTSDFIIDEKDDDNGADKGSWETLQNAIDGAKDYADIKTTPYFIYEMDETVVANSIDVRFIIPSIADLSNVPDDEKITMYVCTDKGNFEMQLTDKSNYQFSESTLVALKNAAMQRNTSYTLRTKANALVDSPNASIFFNNVVSTAADWNKLVEEYGDLRKYAKDYTESDQDDLIVNIISDKFALTSDLKMPEVAEFIIKSDVNVEGEVTLKNITVKEGKLIVKKDATLTTDPTLDAASVEVEVGGELVFAAEYNKDEELVAYDAITTVHNHGTVTVPAGVIAEFTLQNADKDAVLNVGAAASRAAEVAEAKAILAGYNYGTVNNYSVIDAVGFTNEAAAEKNGEEETGYEYDTEAQEWNGTPTVKNFATFNAKGSVANKGLFENHSVLTSNFVGAAEFANTGVLDIKSGAETYIDLNSNADGTVDGTIVLAELTPAKGLTIYKARKDAHFNPTADEFKYRGIIKHTLVGKTTEALDLSASPVNYLVANADVEIGKTYTWTDNSGSTAVTNIYPLETLEVTDGIVTLAARTGAGTEASPYVYPAQVANLIVNGEVDIDGEMYSPMIEKLTVNAGGVFGVPADAMLQILLADIKTEASKVVDEKTLAAGKVSVVGTLLLEDKHSSNAVGVTTWPKGEDNEYTSADFGYKNIEINKDAEVKCAANTTPTVDNKDVVNRIVTLNSNQLGDVFKATGWSTIDGNDTYTLVLTQDVDMSSTVKGTYKNGTTEYKEKTNADMVSVLTGAKEVVLRANLIGLKEGTAVTTLNALSVDGLVTISGSKNVNILKVKKLAVPDGSSLNIEGGYLVIDEVAVENKGTEKIDIQGVYNSRIIAYNSDDEMLYWDNVNSVWTRNADFAHDNSEVTLNVSTAASLADAVKNNVGTVVLTDDVVIEETLVFNAPIKTAAYSRNNKLYEVSLDLNGKTLTNNINELVKVGAGVKLTISNGGLVKNDINGASVIINEGDLTLEEVEIVGSGVTADVNDKYWPEYAVATIGGNLTIEEGTVISSGRGALHMSEGGNVTINGGELEITDGLGERSLTIHMIYAGNDSKLEIRGGTFTHDYKPGKDNGSSIICPAGAEIEVYNGDFSYAGPQNGQGGIFQNYMGYGKHVYVYGGTYNDNTFEKNLFKGYQGKANEDGTYTVVKTE